MSDTNKKMVLEALRQQGRATALALQEKAGSLTGTELNAKADYVPDFLEAKKQKNMLYRHAGLTDGFVCKTSAGRVVRLLQNYDSEIYHAEPEDLSAQWGFVWSDNPEHAKPFIALSTSPYMIGDCCTENGNIYRSKEDYNVHSPADYPHGWDVIE